MDSSLTRLFQVDPTLFQTFKPLLAWNLGSVKNTIGAYLSPLYG